MDISQKAPDVIIRKAADSELEEICQKTTALGPWRNLGIESDVMQYRIEGDKDLKVFVAESNGELSGVIIYRKGSGAQILFAIGFGKELADRYGLTHYAHWQEVPSCTYITHLAVFDNCRGQGIGKQLLKWVGTDLSESGILRLCVSDTNPNARRFYEREGFERIATRKNVIREGNIEHLMERVFSSGNQ